MGLESATYIDGLNSAWPLDNDFIREADDHMRLIKSTIQNSFPNITGAMNATQAELNLLVGQTSFPGVAGVDQQVQFNSGGNFAGSSNMIFDGTLFTAGGLASLNLVTVGLSDINPYGVVRDGDVGSMFISGGPSQALGAHITMYGGSHGTVPGNMAFTVDADDDFMVWNQSTGELTINKLAAASKTPAAVFGVTQFDFTSNIVNIRSSEAGDPTAGGTITANITFESSNPNNFGTIGYRSSGDSLDIVNAALDADVNIFASDGVSFTSDYGITLNSQALAINLDVAGLPDTLMDFDSSGAAVITDASIFLYTYIKGYPLAGPGTDGFVLAWNDTAGQIELTAGGGGGVIGGSITNDQIAFGAATANDIEGSTELTWNGSFLTIGDDTDASAGLVFASTATGSPFINFNQNTATKAFAQYQNGTGFVLDSDDNILLTVGTVAQLTISTGAAVFRGGIDLQNSGTIRAIERADHAYTPAATFGEIWVKNTVPNTLIFTDDAGTDWTLNAAGGGISAVVDDASPQLGGDLDANGFDFITANAGSGGSSDSIFIITGTADGDGITGTTSVGDITIQPGEVDTQVIGGTEQAGSLVLAGGDTDGGAPGNGGGDITIRAGFRVPAGPQVGTISIESNDPVQINRINATGANVGLDIIDGSNPVNIRLAGDGADPGVGSLDLISASGLDQVLSRGNATALQVGSNGGGTMTFYDDGHATLPGDIQMLSGANVFLDWDESAGELQILTDTGGKTLALTIDSNQVATFATDVAVTGELEIEAYSEDADSYTVTVGTKALDLSAATYFYPTGAMTAVAVDFTFDNPVASGRVTSFTLELNNMTANTDATPWPAGVEWAGGSEPTWTSGIDIVSFVTRDGGTTWYGFPGGLDFS